MNLKSAIMLIIDSAFRKAMLCAENNLLCVDIPAVTTHELKKHGIKSYSTIESFWKTISALTRHLSEKECVSIYKYNGLMLRLDLVHDKNNVYLSRKLDIVLDPLDCYAHKHELDCIEIPHTHTLKVQLDVKTFNRTIAQFNVVYLLKLLLESNAKLFMELRECIEKYIKEARTDNIVSIALKISAHYRSIFKKTLPYIPSTYSDILKCIPILRRIVKNT